ncbi:hypothetical protein EJ04DRAFT_511695 [Polyplosphaeria fusca]|uniref:Uncharacterized protein n=1 Tax=Polyplosphaeria fusca TaxID=682080 RepID=A0A9P4QXP6_9PLEO|nr:hypothetical protein EJ04DRAFT_511695 [Polyplosphaeria fusca]
MAERATTPGLAGTQEPHMIIAIDFGTTYSGVCWVSSKKPEHVNTIVSWNNSSGSAKVPSKIQFNGWEPVDWGFEVEDSVTTFSWFKLILDYEELPREIKNSDRVQETYGKLREWARDWYEGDPLKAAERVAAKYLKMLWRHAITVIRDKGLSWIEDTHCKVVITRPAIWSPRATLRTRTAAEEAIRSDTSPFRSVSISTITEPEAAAQAVLQDEAPDSELEDIYVICDAGGGTVDVISYMFKSIRPLQVHESVGGKGDLCGSVFIDEAFERDLKVRIGNLNWPKLTSQHRRRIMERQWDVVKKQFNPSIRQRPFIIDTFVSSEKYEQGHMVALFQPACGRARALVDDQVECIRRAYQRNPKAVVLVGGMGASKYLVQELRLQCQGKGIKVQFDDGPDPWSAVCRGAAMAVASGGRTVASRVSRLHYGLAYESVHDRARDHIVDRLVNEQHGATSARNDTMQWLVSKGERIRSLRRKTLPYRQYIALPTQMTYKQFATEIWVCEDDEAPERMSPRVKPHCKIICAVPEALPTLTTATGIRYQMIEVQIVVCPNGNMLEFAIHFGGSEIPNVLQWPDGSSVGGALEMLVERREIQV